MPETQEVILEKPESDQTLDESLNDYRGEEGEAPQDEEFTALPDELPDGVSGNFAFRREAAPMDEESTFEKVEKEKGGEPIPWYKDKKFLYLIGLSLSITSVLIFILMYLTFSEGNIKPDIVATKPLEQEAVADESYRYDEDMSRVDGMIQKANALYLKGEIEQALKVYEQVAVFNESLSNYNLGVLHMNEGNFTEALKSFQEAIKKGENQSVAAINAAVSALKLKDKEKFKYYINLAEVYLSREGKSKLYDYYLSLINYYKGYYPEALQMLQKTDVDPYTDTAKYLSAKIYAKMDLDSKAVQELSSQENFESSLSLGLLYARMGQYEKAKGALNTAMKIDRDFNRSLAAISLVDLKMGNYRDMLARLNNAYSLDIDKYEILSKYKIKVGLNKDLFNINIAQKNFSKDLLKNGKNQFDLLFYFAPYQVFDSKQASLYIKKGNIADFIDDSGDAGGYLTTSKAISSTNVRIAKVINYAFDRQLKLANKEFQSLLKDYPEHSILHYNLALSHAQLGNYELAYKHFLSSYHLNPRNYLAGAFAIFCAKIIDVDVTRFYNEITESIMADPEFKEGLQRMMVFLAGESYVSMLPYLEEEKQDTPLSLMLEAVVAKVNGLDNQVGVKISKLRALLPDDIIANILYFNTLNEDLDIKEYSQNAQSYFRNSEFDYKSLFYGPDIVREYYVSLMQIAGLLNLKREKVKHLINTSDLEDEDAMQTLAYMDIFAGQFQEAYTLYDLLTDDYEIEDSKTFFLAAVAATGANNPNSAMIFLELSKLSDQNNKESKAALGLFYQQLEDYGPALKHYESLPNNFKSEFFTFDIRKN